MLDYKETSGETESALMEADLQGIQGISAWEGSQGTVVYARIYPTARRESSGWSTWSTWSMYLTTHPSDQWLKSTRNCSRCDGEGKEEASPA